MAGTPVPCIPEASVGTGRGCGWGPSAGTCDLPPLRKHRKAAGSPGVGRFCVRSGWAHGLCPVVSAGSQAEPLPRAQVFLQGVFIFASLGGGRPRPVPAELARGAPVSVFGFGSVRYPSPRGQGHTPAVLVDPRHGLSRPAQPRAGITPLQGSGAALWLPASSPGPRRCHHGGSGTCLLS